MGTSPHGTSLEALNGKVTYEQIAPLDISKFNGSWGCVCLVEKGEHPPKLLTFVCV